MQAFESNNATGFLKPASQPDSQLIPNLNAKPDSISARIMPSAFSAPIQAARKYLERQRGDTGQVDPQRVHLSPGPASQHGEEGAGGDQEAGSAPSIKGTRSNLT